MESGNQNDQGRTPGSHQNKASQQLLNSPKVTSFTNNTVGKEFVEQRASQNHDAPHPGSNQYKGSTNKIHNPLDLDVSMQAVTENNKPVDTSIDNELHRMQQHQLKKQSETMKTGQKVLKPNDRENRVPNNYNLEYHYQHDEREGKSDHKLSAAAKAAKNLTYTEAARARKISQRTDKTQDDSSSLSRDQNQGEDPDESFFRGQGRGDQYTEQINHKDYQSNGT